MQPLEEWVKTMAVERDREARRLALSALASEHGRAGRGGLQGSFSIPGSVAAMFRRSNEHLDALATVPLFRGLGRRQVRLVERAADRVEKGPGAVLAKQGALSREFFLIVDGRARVERDGTKIADLAAGDFFGEMALIDGDPRSASVIAETPLSLLVIAPRAFAKLMAAVPEVQRRILVGVTQRLRNADEALTATN